LFHVAGLESSLGRGRRLSCLTCALGMIGASKAIPVDSRFAQSVTKARRRRMTDSDYMRSSLSTIKGSPEKNNAAPSVRTELCDRNGRRPPCDRDRPDAESRADRRMSLPLNRKTY
jgi:predicted ATPase